MKLDKEKSCDTKDKITSHSAINKFEDLLNFLVICKLGNEVNNKEYNPNCKNISHAKEILLLELYKQKGKKNYK